MNQHAKTLAAMELHREENLTARLGEIHREISKPVDRGQDLRDAIAYLIDQSYGSPCFTASESMASRLGPQALSCANLLAANIAAAQGECGLQECLGHAIQRIFTEAYGAADAASVNQMAGILASLSSLAHPGLVDLLGMLAVRSADVLAQRHGAAKS